MARLGNVLWIVDVNRQSLDRIVPDARRRQLPELFRTFGWNAIELRYGSKVQALFGRPGGKRLRARLDAMPYAEYQSLLRLPAAAARKALVTGAGGETDRALDRLLASVDDDALRALLADLGGHDLALILDALDEAARHRDGPSVIVAHTIKGWGLPLAGDPMNHTALLTTAQVEALRASLGISPGDEWARFDEGSAEAELIRRLPPLYDKPVASPRITGIPAEIGETYASPTSTQEAFGRVLGALARQPAGDAIVTVSADVAVTTHLAGWISRKGVYFPEARPNYFAELPQAVPWKESPAGQHVELGIAEHNLFLLLGALGLTRELSGRALLPIGTLYDPFVTRGLDALYHALYSGARFIVVATPSGVTLSPEGGAHQSVITPGIGIALPDIVYWEPVFAREVEWILLDALARLGDDAEGRSTYLRLSTRPIDQRLAPAPDAGYRAQVLRGAYRLVDARGEPGWDPETNAVHLFAVRRRGAGGAGGGARAARRRDLGQRVRRDQPRPALPRAARAAPVPGGTGRSRRGGRARGLGPRRSLARPRLSRWRAGRPADGPGRGPLRAIRHPRRPVSPLRHRRPGHGARGPRAPRRLARRVGPSPRAWCVSASSRRRSPPAPPRASRDRPAPRSAGHRPARADPAPGSAASTCPGWPCG